MYALDTNAVIHFFKGEGKLAQNMLGKAPKNIHISMITVYELEVGVLKSKERVKEKMDQLEQFLNLCFLCPFERKESKIAAKIRTELEQKGNVIGPMDILIAACAMANGLILVTHNTKEFARVKGLKLEDWY